MTYTETTDLLGQFHRLEWLLRYRHMRDQHERGPMGDPHRGQGRILALLKLQPEIDQRELAAILDIRPQSLGELLSKLERQGFVNRKPSESDRRVMEIRLTEEGKKAAEESAPTEEAEALFACLTEEEQKTLAGLLERIIADWEKGLGADSEAGEARMGWGGRGFGRGRGPGRPGGFPGYGPNAGRGPRGFHFGGRCFGGFPTDGE